MSMLLIIVTALSLAFAVVLLALNWRLVREKRLRSAARVEALLEAVSALPAAADATPQIVVDHTKTAVSSSRELFHQAAEGPSGFGRLAVPMSLGVVIISAVLAGLLMWNHGRAKAAPVASAAFAADNSAAVPVELMSLRHERTANGLTITGLVRNPAGGRRVSDLSVVVFLFDRNGAFVTSARELLDFRTLAPGDESPFTISLDEIGSVGRYRVSFRADDKVVPHVDRRQDPAAVAAGFGEPGRS